MSECRRMCTSSHLPPDVQVHVFRNCTYKVMCGHIIEHCFEIFPGIVGILCKISCGTLSLSPIIPINRQVRKQCIEIRGGNIVINDEDVHLQNKSLIERVSGSTAARSIRTNVPSAKFLDFLQSKGKVCLILYD